MFQTTIWPEMFYSINNFTAGMSALPWLGAAFILWIIVAKSWCYVKNFEFKAANLFWLPLFAIWFLGFGLGDMLAYAKEWQVNQPLLAYNSGERQDYRFCEMLIGSPEQALKACPLGALFEKIEANIQPGDKIYIAYPIEIFNFYFRLRLLPKYQLINNPKEAKAIIFFQATQEFSCSEEKNILTCWGANGEDWGHLRPVLYLGGVAGVFVRVN